MLAPLGVVVWQHHNIGAAQVLRKFITPLFTSARICRRGEADGVEIFGILLPLRDANRFAGGHGVDEFGQPVGDAARVLQVPNPTTASVWAPLAKIFGIETDDLANNNAPPSSR